MSPANIGSDSSPCARLLKNPSQESFSRILFKNPSQESFSRILLKNPFQESFSRIPSMPRRDPVGFLRTELKQTRSSPWLSPGGILRRNPEEESWLNPGRIFDICGWRIQRVKKRCKESSRILKRVFKSLEETPRILQTSPRILQESFKYHQESSITLKNLQKSFKNPSRILKSL